MIRRPASPRWQHQGGGRGQPAHCQVPQPSFGPAVHPGTGGQPADRRRRALGAGRRTSAARCQEVGEADQGLGERLSGVLSHQVGDTPLTGVGLKGLGGFVHDGVDPPSMMVLIHQGARASARALLLVKAGGRPVAVCSVQCAVCSVRLDGSPLSAGPTHSPDLVDHCWAAMAATCPATAHSFGGPWRPSRTSWPGTARRRRSFSPAERLPARTAAPCTQPVPGRSRNAPLGSGSRP